MKFPTVFTLICGSESNTFEAWIFSKCGMSDLTKIRGLNPPPLGGLTMPLKPFGYSRIPVFSGDASVARVTEHGECQFPVKCLIGRSFEI
jgi:hypothetical protein